jgi:acetolactate synthase small subunit
MPSRIFAMSLSPVAASVTDADESTFSVCFYIHARAEPGVMPRVVELFAKRGLVPDNWHSTVAGPMLTIDMRIAGLGREVADFLARSMRQIIGVEAVLTSDARLFS